MDRAAIFLGILLLSPHNFSSAPFFNLLRFVIFLLLGLDIASNFFMRYAVLNIFVIDSIILFLRFSYDSHLTLEFTIALPYIDHIYSVLLTGAWPLHLHTC